MPFTFLCFSHFSRSTASDSFVLVCLVASYRIRPLSRPEVRVDVLFWRIAPDSLRTCSLQGHRNTHNNDVIGLVDTATMQFIQVLTARVRTFQERHFLAATELRRRWNNRLSRPAAQGGKDGALKGRSRGAHGCVCACACVQRALEPPFACLALPCLHACLFVSSRVCVCVFHDKGFKGTPTGNRPC